MTSVWLILQLSDISANMIEDLELCLTKHRHNFVVLRRYILSSVLNGRSFFLLVWLKADIRRALCTPHEKPINGRRWRKLIGLRWQHLFSWEGEEISQGEEVWTVSKRITTPPWEIDQPQQRKRKKELRLIVWELTACTRVLHLDVRWRKHTTKPRSCHKVGK